MQSIKRSETSPGLAAGRLEGISLPDLMWALSQRRKTGVLRIHRERIVKTLYVQDGRIVFAASSDPNDRLGEVLLRQGKVTLDQLEEGLTRLHSGKRLGTLLVETGSLTPDELVGAVLGQVRSILLDLMDWEEGEYSFEEGPLPTQEVITLQMKTSVLLLHAIRNVRSFTRIRRSVGPARTVYGLTDQASEALDGLGLNEGEELLIERLKSGDESVEDLCREVFFSNFEIYQALWAFKVLGVVRSREHSRATTDESSLEGRLGEGGFAELLVRIGREGDTGVLYMSRGAAERAFHVRGGRCVFATSNSPDDGLIAYLLRRGVISLADREETARRLLSNKRVGTILREMGIIDDRDLGEMVREQVTEIVLDTFRWEEADYAFVPGLLPSTEDITLDLGVPALVAQGLRRIAAWTRVIRGCGGVDAPLALTARYLDVLDAMNAGVDEWQVVAALKTPQSPRRLCRQSNLADFRVCQILWALRLLGAIEVQAVEAVERLSADAVLEPPSATTQKIDREQVERILAGANGPPPSEPVTAPVAWDAETRPGPEVAPAVADDPGSSQAGPLEVDGLSADDLDEVISLFNAMHRMIYRAVRAEIGAGAVNFVRSCFGQQDLAEAIEGAELQPDGSWDAEALKRLVQDRRIRDPRGLYLRLIEREIDSLRAHLGESRAGELERQILRIGRVTTDPEPLPDSSPAQTARPPV